MKDEHPSIANRDWRLYAVTTLEKDFKSPWTGILHKGGTPVCATAFAKQHKEILSFGAPTPPAMYLSLARKALKAAIEFFAQDTRNWRVKSTGFDQVLSDFEPHFLDALENLVACIVFSYTALEAFANMMIPDDFNYERERSDQRFKEVYTREQIERFMSLDIKLHEILPKICSVRSPKGTKLWQDYVWLQELRDRCVHLKSSDWQHSSPEKVDEYVWTRLLSDRVRKAPQISFLLMRHYHPSEQLRWLNKFSMLDPV